MSTLKGKITLNTEAFKKGVAKVKDMARKMGRNMVDKFKKAGKAIALGIGAGMAAAGVATLIAAKKILEAGDQIQKMGLKTGFSAEELTRLKHAAELSGSSIEGIDKSIKTMQKSIFDADRGTKLMVDNFAELGLKVEDLKKLSPEEQFKVISEKLAKIADPTKRAALAMQLFGRTGRDLLPMLAEGSEGLQKMKDDADKLGITMSQEQVNNIAEFNDSVDRMKKSILGMFQAALGFEDMRFLVDRVTASVIAFRESTFFQNAIQNITNLAKNTLAAGNGIINVVSKTGASFFKLAGMVGAAGIAAVVALKTGMVLPIIGALAALQVFIAGLSLGKAIYDSFDFGNLWQNVKTQFQSGLDNIGATIAFKLGDIDEEEYIRQIGENSDKTKNAWNEKKVVVGDAMEKFKENYKNYNKDLLNIIGQQIGIDNVPEEIKNIISSYKEGVGEFEKATMGEAGEEGKGAIGQQVEQAKDLNKQLARAGKQVSFVVNMDKFKESQRPKGGVGSRALRAAGQSARDRFKATNDRFRKSFKSAGDRARKHFATAGVPEELQEERTRRRRNLRVENRNLNGAGKNIGEGVENHSSAMSNLVNLAKSRNEKLDAMISMLGSKGRFQV
jgi:hypothetical protein